MVFNSQKEIYNDENKGEKKSVHQKTNMHENAQKKTLNHK
jgi:hypothetical protein